MGTFRRISWLSAALALALGVACSSQARDTDVGGLPGGGSGGDGGGRSDGALFTDASGAAANNTDGSAFGDGNVDPAKVVATLRGTVHAPNQQIPISGALVYVTDTAPPALVHGVHCDECVTLTTDIPYVLSKPDGSFELPATSLGDRYLVVQKGGFRRYRKITIQAGPQDIAADVTTMPAAENAAAGDDIPSMVVAAGTFDQIEQTIARLGVDPAAFTVLPNDYNTMHAFLQDATKMSQYEIIFLPCGFSWTIPSDTVVQQNLKNYVAAGGRVYVTDFLYDFVHIIWPPYVTFNGQSGNTCSGCSQNEYSTPANIQDQGLADWLAAQGITSFDLQANYTRIDSVHSAPGPDKTGATVTIDPKVWMRGGDQQVHTVSFEQGCGRTLFSTYHSEASGSLLPQERALLYILLEVSVCTASPAGVVVK